KHNNWSMADSRGRNLLEPGSTPESNLVFLVFLVCTLKAVHRRASMMRASIASAGNDHRLGANEAPPAIMSVFLGEELSAILNAIEQNEVNVTEDRQSISLGLSQLPPVARDNTDRNRTSPFAFTGNKFEFRAVPSSMPVAMPNAVLNTAVAEAIDEFAAKLGARLESGAHLEAAVWALLREEVLATKAIRFEGDGYSVEWVKEAEARGLPNLRTTPEALEAWREPSNRALFVRYGVLSEAELEARYRVRLEEYVNKIEIEGKTLLRMTRTEILPACLRYQGEFAESFDNLQRQASRLGLSDEVSERQAGLLRALSGDIAALIERAEKLDAAVSGLRSQGSLEDEARYCADTLLAAADDVRELCDRLEIRVDRKQWPFPTYLDLLFHN
ncbi:MAG: hypothetical protein KC486_32690, partial [Myxococcales bacterium]|nr:hypothetical protein [Myxococcales bacterium]